MPLGENSTKINSFTPKENIVRFNDLHLHRSDPPYFQNTLKILKVYGMHMFD